MQTKRFLQLSLAVLGMGLLGACSSDRLDDVEKRVDVIESKSIASINGQIDGINASITELKNADKSVLAQIEELQRVAGGHQLLIDDLKAQDEALNRRIGELQSYVDGELKKYATEDWANATFATLEEYQKTCQTVAELKAAVDGMDAKISAAVNAAIAPLEASIKAWVATQLEGYYTAAQADAKLAAMKSDLEATIAAGDSKNADAIAEAKADIAKLEADLNQAKKDLTAEYQKAISDAINGNDGYINDKIRQEFDNANSRIDILTAQVSDLETKVDALTGRVEKLEKMIQSASIVPAYDDGSVKAENGILTLKAVVSPAAALNGIVTLKDSLKIYADYAEVKTRKGGFTVVDVTEAEIADAGNGIISLKADVSSVLPESDKEVLTVALNIRNGISNFTTEFVKVTVVNLPPVVTDEFSVSSTTKVKFSPGNLYCTRSGSPNNWTYTFAFENNQWDYRSCNFTEGGTTYTGNSYIGGTEGDTPENTSGLFQWLKSDIDETKAGVIEAKKNYGAFSVLDDAVTGTTTDALFADWGTSIDGSKWRTLSKAEWNYLLSTRKVMTNKTSYGEGNVNGVNGLIILPDDWDESVGSFNYGSTSFTNNTFNETTTPKWSDMESAGCVFLPCAGDRHHSTVINVGRFGLYWSSSPDASNVLDAYNLYFYAGEVSLQYGNLRLNGFTVRLVCLSE